MDATDVEDILLMVGRAHLSIDTDRVFTMHKTHKRKRTFNSAETVTWLTPIVHRVSPPHPEDYPLPFLQLNTSFFSSRP